MTNYVVTAAARLSSGVLHLTKVQASERMHNLNALGNDRYEIVKPVAFKAGEKIGFEGDLQKSLAEALIDSAKAEETKPKAVKKSKAEEAKLDEAGD